MQRMMKMWTGFAVLILSTSVTPAEDFQPKISVTGEGTASAAPDMATIQTGVVSQAPTAKEALAANSKTMEAILAVLKERQIAARNVQTSQFNVQPIYNSDRQGRTMPQIEAYQVTNQVHVRVRKLDELGEVLDALVQGGSNEISGISFGLADPSPVLDEARRSAVANARSRAELYAKEAGVKLGKVRSISEQASRPPQPFAMARGFVAEAAAVPLATGENEYRVSIDMEFALEDAE